jgi:glycine dehydrogenase subunit 1
MAAVRRRCVRRGVNPGVDVGELSGRDEDRGVLLVAITERRSRADIDRLADVLEAAIVAERDPAAARSSLGGPAQLVGEDPVADEAVGV